VKVGFNAVTGFLWRKIAHLIAGKGHEPSRLERKEDKTDRTIQGLAQGRPLASDKRAKLTRRSKRVFFEMP